MESIPDVSKAKREKSFINPTQESDDPVHKHERGPLATVLFEMASYTR
jgi:hypothetical protein